MEGFKFEIGEMVRHKLGANQKVLILEKHAQFCYGGLRQNWYVCVLGSFHPMQFEAEKRFRFSELELERAEKE